MDRKDKIAADKEFVRQAIAATRDDEAAKKRLGAKALRGTQALTTEQRIKAAENKVPLALLSDLALDEVGKVLAFGAQKYRDNLWRDEPTKWSARLSSAKRHLSAWSRGQDKDPETGISHLAHAMCQLMFLLEYETTHPENDDRYKVEVSHE